MPLDWVPGESSEVLIDHADGRRGRSCPRGPHPSRVVDDKPGSRNGRDRASSIFEGSKLQLAPSPTSPPLEDLVVRRQRPSELESSRRS
jgi:hypothetical protein